MSKSVIKRMRIQGRLDDECYEFGCQCAKYQESIANLERLKAEMLAALRVVAEHPCGGCGVGASSGSHAPDCVIGRAIEKATGEEMIDERLPGGKFYLG